MNIETKIINKIFANQIHNTLQRPYTIIKLVSFQSFIYEWFKSIHIAVHMFKDRNQAGEIYGSVGRVLAA